jgi:transcription antitermination factor NusG
MLEGKGKSGKRMLAVTENYQASSVGVNYKPIDEKLKVIKKMGVGSKVRIISGPHKDLDGKIVAVTKSGTHGMSEDINQNIDPESYVSVELKLNNTIFQVKRKRIEMIEKVLNRSRSRSNSPKINQKE